MLRIFVVWLALTGANVTAATVFGFNTLPVGGMVSGVPGQTVGWGYSISNPDSGLWLVLTNVTSDPFLTGLPSFVFDFPIVAPGTQVLEPFDTGQGLLQETISPAAVVGSSDIGVFTLSAQWYTANPLAGGVFIQDATDQVAPYSVLVSQVPEPRTVLMALLILLLIAPKKACVFLSRRFRDLAPSRCV